MRDAIIEKAIHEPGAYLRCLRVCGTGVWVASVLTRGEILAEGRATSLSAALDALAQALTTRAA